MIRKLSMLTMGVMLVSFAMKAQNGTYISLSEAVTTASQNNANVKMAELDKRVANANYRQTDAVFLPQVDLSYTALSTNNPLNAFGFLLQQSSVTQMDFDPAKLNDPGSAQDYSAKVEAKLPLFNLDMIYARKGAKAQEEIYKYKAQRTQEYIAYETKKAYTQLQMSYRAVNILQSSLTDVKKIHQTVSNFYAQGLAQKSDVLNAQVQVNTVETALTKAQSNIHNASDGLRLLMGLDQSDDIYKVDELAQNTQSVEQVSVSSSRSDFMALSKAVDATNMMVKSSKMAFLPRVNAFGSYQLNDSKAFGFKADSYLVGINLSWNIFSGNQNKNKVKSYQFQRDKMQQDLNLHLQQGQMELNKNQRDLLDAQTEINQQNISIEQASEALRILENRYKEGLANTTDVLMAQAQLSQQKLLHSQAVMNYNITHAYIEFLTETK